MTTTDQALSTGRSSPPALRLSLTLPGSASLGAFQAGALAALSVVVTTLHQRGRAVHLDAIGGASAGSIVATLFTYGLLTGVDTPPRRQLQPDLRRLSRVRARPRDRPG